MHSWRCQDAQREWKHYPLTSHGWEGGGRDRETWGLRKIREVRKEERRKPCLFHTISLYRPHNQERGRGNLYFSFPTLSCVGLCFPDGVGSVLLGHVTHLAGALLHGPLPPLPSLWQWRELPSKGHSSQRSRGIPDSSPPRLLQQLLIVKSC